MSIDLFQKIKEVSIENNNYQITALTSSENETAFEFIWGKHYFTAICSRETDHFSLKTFKMKKNDTWHDYVKVSEHGIFFEETLWQSSEGKKVYIELPAKFAGIPAKILNSIKPD